MRAIGVKPSTNPDFPTSGRELLRGSSRHLLPEPGSRATRRSNGARRTATRTRPRTGSRPTAMLGRWNNSLFARAWMVAEPVGQRVHVAGTLGGRPQLRCESGAAQAAAHLLPKQLPATYGELVDVLSRSGLLHQKMRGSTARQCSPSSARRPTSPLLATDSAVTWKLGRLVALILDSPYHALR